MAGFGVSEGPMSPTRKQSPMITLLIVLATLWITALVVITLAGNSTSAMADRALSSDETIVVSPSREHSSLAA